MEQLTAIFEEATRRISPMHFHVQIDGGDSVYRERVYSYELYHQMRSLWPADTPFYLNGELDKAAHPIFRELGAGHSKPDLLIHQPGCMSGNHAIVEVKSSRAPIAGIRKDIASLAMFRTKIGYERAIYLIFGHESTAAPERVLRAAVDMGCLPPIELWLHSFTGAAATRTHVIGRPGNGVSPLVAPRYA